MAEESFAGSFPASFALGYDFSTRLITLSSMLADAILLSFMMGAERAVDARLWIAGRHSRRGGLPTTL